MSEVGSGSLWLLLTAHPFFRDSAFLLILWVWWQNALWGSWWFKWHAVIVSDIWTLGPQLMVLLGAFGDVNLMEEVCHSRWALSLQSFCFLLVVQGVSLQLPALSPCLCPATIDSNFLEPHTLASKSCFGNVILSQ